MILKRLSSIAKVVGYVVVAIAAVPAAAQGVPSLEDFPRFECDLSNLDGISVDDSAAVTIDLTRTEREVLNLAIPGYIADLEAEFEGTREHFPNRAFGLGLFIKTTVPCIDEMINDPSRVGQDGAILGTSFNSFERVATQIMMSIWNARDGVLAHHIRGCRRSRELRNALEFEGAPQPNLCSTFFPLADAASSLFRKVTRDQRP